MSGWVKIHRGWFNDPDFPKEPFTEREAWHWLIEAAAYEDHSRWFSGNRIDLKRGELAVSQRTMADVWGWGRQSVRRYLDKLQMVFKIEKKSTHRLTHITICNYAKYQDSKPTAQPSPNPVPTQSQPIKEEGKEGKEGKEDNLAASPYAFEGRVVRLKHAQFAAWQKAYPALDLNAALQSRDDWLATEATDHGRKGWFMSTSNWLNGKQQEATKAGTRIPDWQQGDALC